MFSDKGTQEKQKTRCQTNIKDKMFRYKLKHKKLQTKRNSSNWLTGFHLSIFSTFHEFRSQSELHNKHNYVQKKLSRGSYTAVKELNCRRPHRQSNRRSWEATVVVGKWETGEQVSVSWLGPAGGQVVKCTVRIGLMQQLSSSISDFSLLVLFIRVSRVRFSRLSYLNKLVSVIVRLRLENFRPKCEHWRHMSGESKVLIQKLGKYKRVRQKVKTVPKKQKPGSP